MSNDEKKVEGIKPTSRDAAFWADLSYTLINEITCPCGHVNKVQDEWHTGLYKVECGGCFEELDIASILKVPDRSLVLLHCIESDIRQTDSLEDEIRKRIEKYEVKVNPVPENPCKEITVNELMDSLPPSVAKEVLEYAQWLQEQDNLRLKRKEKEKSDYQKWIEEGDRRKKRGDHE